jgi:hypothetical protein
MAKEKVACVTAAIIVLAFISCAQQFQPSPKTQREMMKNNAKYDKETSPVGRAKALAKLGRTELKAALEAADANNADSALQFVKTYDTQAQEAHEALLKTGVNAEKHSGGFRQLQISVRESARTLRQIASQVPFTQRQPFVDLQSDLNALNQKLILELFPRQPGHDGDKPRDKEEP